MDNSPAPVYTYSLQRGKSGARLRVVKRRHDADPYVAASGWFSDEGRARAALAQLRAVAAENAAANLTRATRKASQHE